MDEDLLLDGAFLDNIPVYPLIEKDLDYIFCVYFDNCQYVFETPEFDRKIIKLIDFPNEKRLELMTFDPGQFDNMVMYGYDYTAKVLKEIFDDTDTINVYDKIKARELNSDITFKPRFTADIVLNNINIMAKKYSKRLSTREKNKK